MRTDDPHDLTGAFAADALSREERERFRRHLAECPDCAHEAARQQEAAAWLAVAVARTPPPGLKEHVLAEAARAPQFPPEPAERAAERGRWSGPRLLRVALAASLAAAAALGGVAIWQSQEAQETRQEARSDAADLARLLTAPDTAFVKKDIAYGGYGTVAISRRLNQAAYFCQDLAPLPSGRTYQLWYAAPRADLRSAGLVPAEPGVQAVALPAPGGAASLAITVEPGRGSPEPTTRVLASWPLPGS